MPVDRQAKLIFVHIPKTAGTSIEVALNIFGDWRNENLFNLFGQITSPRLLRKNFSSNFLQHLQLHEIQRLLGAEFAEYEIFTVVRDPWTRFLSSFRRKDPDLCSYVRWRSSCELEDLSLFDYFKIVRWARHPHLNSQLSFFRPASTSLTVKDVLKKVRIFRFEELSLLEQWLSVKYDKPINFMRHQCPVSAIPEMTEGELINLKRKVFNFYRQDYRLFGYELT